MAADYKLSSTFDEERHHGTTKQYVDDGSSNGALDSYEGYVVEKAMEKRMLRKFDFIILPTVALMYLFNSIDKSNLGNAYTDGFTDDLGFVGSQYNILLSIFYGMKRSYLLYLIRSTSVKLWLRGRWLVR